MTQLFTRGLMTQKLTNVVYRTALLCIDLLSHFQLNSIFKSCVLPLFQVKGRLSPLCLSKVKCLQISCFVDLCPVSLFSYNSFSYIFCGIFWLIFKAVRMSKIYYLMEFLANINSDIRVPITAHRLHFRFTVHVALRCSVKRAVAIQCSV